jgi:hypothetical protein
VQPTPRRGLSDPAFAGRLRSSRPIVGHQQRFVGEPVVISALEVKAPQLTSIPKSTVPQKLATSMEFTATNKKSETVKHKANHAKAAHSTQLRSAVLQRNAVQKSAAVVYRQTRKRKLTRTAVMNIVAATAFTVGLVSTISSWYTVHNLGARPAHLMGANLPAPQEDKDPAEQTMELPIEQPPTLDTVKKYTVGADEPRFLKIGKLNVFARARPISLKTQVEPNSPANIFDAGWYKGSSKLGEKGATLIHAHVSGATQHGVFYDIDKLTAGDLIAVTRGDGKEFIYKVVSKKMFEKGNVDMSTALNSIMPGKSGLNLLTTPDDEKPRILVFAVQI